MRGMNIRYNPNAKDPEGSPAVGWEVRYFKKILGAGFAENTKDAEKAAAMCLGEALAQQIVTSRDRNRAKAKLAEMCERRPYLVIGVSRLIMRDGTVERVMREATQEEAAIFDETPKALRLIGLPSDPRARTPEEAAQRMIDLCIKAGLLSWKEEGVLEASGRFKSFMMRQFGGAALGLAETEADRNVARALELIGKKEKPVSKPKKKAKSKGKMTTDDEFGDSYPEEG